MSAAVSFHVKSDITLHRRCYELWLIENVGYAYDSFLVATSYFSNIEHQLSWKMMKADLERVYTISDSGEPDRIVSWRGHGWEIFIVRYYDITTYDKSRYDMVIKFRNELDAVTFKLIKSTLDPSADIFA